jgi:malonyl-CoA/methylmalonyl-CoA synthetase
MASSTPRLAFPAGSPESAALEDAAGTCSYAELERAAGGAAAALLAAAGRGDPAADLEGRRVALLAPPGAEFAAALLGIWRAGGVAVPLAAMHPPGEHAHVLDDSEAALALAHPDDVPRLEPLAPERGLMLLSTAAALSAPHRTLPPVDPARPALILYTSGTTGRPKGAIHTHASLAAQVEAMIAAWGWTPADRILHVLPLHHTHGLVNCLLTPLAAGGCCEFGPPRFDPEATWRRLAAGGISVFMAVPTIYARLLEAFGAAPAAERTAWRAAARALRLAVSGSAALPAALAERWREIAGVPPLERYGMTEIGMALANPLDGERVPGTVGTPMPGVEVRLVDDDGMPAAAGAGSARASGELEVRGPQLFAGYWRRPEETAAAMRPGGWFRTGDEAAVEGGIYRILGRKSVDVLKVGGYKLSALEVEAVLASHPEVAECAVVGAPDPEYGQRVAAAVVPRDPAAAPSLDALRAWAGDRLAPYKLPTRLLVLDELPRNPLGKVTKPALAERFAAVTADRRARGG